MRIGRIILFALTMCAPLSVWAQSPPAPQQPTTPPPQGTPQAASRRGVPQPLVTQTIDYFAGRWNFTWTGRESPLTQGPRSGSVTFVKTGGTSLEGRTEGKSETGPYKETSLVVWSESQKVLAWLDRLGGGVEVLSLGDWSSPLSIRFEAAPVQVKNQTLRLRRTAAIVSPAVFNVTDEIAIDGGPFVRLGNGVFNKEPSAQPKP